MGIKRSEDDKAALAARFKEETDKAALAARLKKKDESESQLKEEKGALAKRLKRAELTHRNESTRFEQLEKAAEEKDAEIERLQKLIAMQPHSRRRSSRKEWSF